MSFQLLIFLTATFHFDYWFFCNGYHLLLALEDQNKNNESSTKNDKFENIDQYFNIALRRRVKDFDK